MFRILLKELFFAGDPAMVPLYMDEEQSTSVCSCTCSCFGHK